MTKHPNDGKIRHHEFDGIQEFDKSLPNWWLFTLYATIAFAVGYWIYFQKTGLGLSQSERLEAELAQIKAVKAAAEAEAGILSDDSLWAMSQRADIVAAGKQVYATTCASCHGPNLEGAIGVNLVDAEWLHGGSPLEVRNTVVNGVLAKGMPAWLPILGDEKVSSVTAFIMSHHQQPR